MIDSEAKRKRMEKMQRAAEPSTATSTGDAKQRKAASTNREVQKQTALLSPQDWPYPDLPQDDPADNNAATLTQSFAGGDRLLVPVHLQG